MIKRLMIMALALIVLFGASPVIAALGAAVVAGLLGCSLNDGGVHACLLFGRDLGGALHAMAASQWFARVTIPLAVMVLVVWAAVALILVVLHRRRQRRKTAQKA